MSLIPAKRSTAIGGLILAVLLQGEARQAGALTELEDGALSAVGGQGVAFNVSELSLGGDLSLTYSGEVGQSLTLGAIELSRTDDPTGLFTDPYRLEVVAREAGLPDEIRLSLPANASDLLSWRYATDLAVTDAGSEFQGGSLVVEGLRQHGGHLSLASPAAGSAEAIHFGQAVQFDIDTVALRPRGRDNGSGQLLVSGIHLGGVDGGPWAWADSSLQPASFRAVTENGESWLEFELDWRESGEASAGTLTIENIRFDAAAPILTDSATAIPATRLNLGSSRIGRFQLNYLNVRLHP